MQEEIQNSESFIVFTLSDVLRVYQTSDPDDVLVDHVLTPSSFSKYISILQGGTRGAKNEITLFPPIPIDGDFALTMYSTMFMQYNKEKSGFFYLVREQYIASMSRIEQVFRRMFRFTELPNVAELTTAFSEHHIDKDEFESLGRFMLHEFMASYGTIIANLASGEQSFASRDDYAKNLKVYGVIDAKYKFYRKPHIVEKPRIEIPSSRERSGQKSSQQRSGAGGGGKFSEKPESHGKQTQGKPYSGDKRTPSGHQTPFGEIIRFNTTGARQDRVLNQDIDGRAAVSSTILNQDEYSERIMSASPQLSKKPASNILTKSELMSNIQSFFSIVSSYVIRYNADGEVEKHYRDVKIDTGIYKCCDAHSGHNSMLFPELSSRTIGNGLTYGYITRNLTCYDLCHTLQSKPAKKDESQSIRTCINIFAKQMETFDNDIAEFMKESLLLKDRKRNLNIATNIYEEKRKDASVYLDSKTIDSLIQLFGNDIFKRIKVKEHASARAKKVVTKEVFAQANMFEHKLLSSFFDKADEFIDYYQNISYSITFGSISGSLCVSNGLSFYEPTEIHSLPENVKRFLVGNKTKSCYFLAKIGSTNGDDFLDISLEDLEQLNMAKKEHDLSLILEHRKSQLVGKKDNSDVLMEQLDQIKREHKILEKKFKANKSNISANKKTMSESELSLIKDEQSRIKPLIDIMALRIAELENYFAMRDTDEVVQGALSGNYTQNVNPQKNYVIRITNLETNITETFEINAVTVQQIFDDVTYEEMRRRLGYFLIESRPKFSFKKVTFETDGESYESYENRCYDIGYLYLKQLNLGKKLFLTYDETVEDDTYSSRQSIYVFPWEMCIRIGAILMSEQIAIFNDVITMPTRIVNVWEQIESKSDLMFIPEMFGYSCMKYHLGMLEIDQTNTIIVSLLLKTSNHEKLKLFDIYEKQHLTNIKNRENVKVQRDIVDSYSAFKIYVDSIRKLDHFMISAKYQVIERFSRDIYEHLFKPFDFGNLNEEEYFENALPLQIASIRRIIESRLNAITESSIVSEVISELSESNIPNINSFDEFCATCGNILLFSNAKEYKRSGFPDSGVPLLTKVVSTHHLAYVPMRLPRETDEKYAQRVIDLQEKSVIIPDFNLNRLCRLLGVDSDSIDIDSLFHDFGEIVRLYNIVIEPNMQGTRATLVTLLTQISFALKMVHVISDNYEVVLPSTEDYDMLYSHVLSLLYSSKLKDTKKVKDLFYAFSDGSNVIPKQTSLEDSLKLIIKFIRMNLAGLERHRVEKVKSLKLALNPPSDVLEGEQKSDSSKIIDEERQVKLKLIDYKFDVMSAISSFYDIINQNTFAFSIYERYKLYVTNFKNVVSKVRALKLKSDIDGNNTISLTDQYNKIQLPVSDDELLTSCKSSLAEFVDCMKIGTFIDGNLISAFDINLNQRKKIFDELLILFDDCQMSRKRFMNIFGTYMYNNYRNLYENQVLISVGNVVERSMNYSQLFLGTESEFTDLVESLYKKKEILTNISSNYYGSNMQVKRITEDYNISCRQVKSCSDIIFSRFVNSSCILSTVIDTYSDVRFVDDSIEDTLENLSQERDVYSSKIEALDIPNLHIYFEFTKLNDEFYSVRRTLFKMFRNVSMVDFNLLFRQATEDFTTDISIFTNEDSDINQFKKKMLTGIQGSLRTTDSRCNIKNDYLTNITYVQHHDRDIQNMNEQIVRIAFIKKEILELLARIFPRIKDFLSSSPIGKIVLPERIMKTKISERINRGLNTYRSFDISEQHVMYDEEVKVSSQQTEIKKIFEFIIDNLQLIDQGPGFHFIVKFINLFIDLIEGEQVTLEQFIALKERLDVFVPNIGQLHTSGRFHSFVNILSGLFDIEFFTDSFSSIGDGFNLNSYRKYPDVTVHSIRLLFECISNVYDDVSQLNDFVTTNFDANNLRNIKTCFLRFKDDYIATMNSKKSGELGAEVTLNDVLVEDLRQNYYLVTSGDCYRPFYSSVETFYMRTIEKNKKLKFNALLEVFFNYFKSVSISMASYYTCEEFMIRR